MTPGATGTGDGRFRSVPSPGLPDRPPRRTPAQSIPARSIPARSTPAQSGNLGRTAQPGRRRSGCPMAAYDALPAPLRAWLARAALPWSPASCLRIWRRLRARGLPVVARLAALDRAEARALAREDRAT